MGNAPVKAEASTVYDIHQVLVEDESISYEKYARRDQLFRFYWEDPHQREYSYPYIESEVLIAMESTLAGPGSCCSREHPDAEPWNPGSRGGG